MCYTIKKYYKIVNATVNGLNVRKHNKRQYIDCKSKLVIKMVSHYYKTIIYLKYNKKLFVIYIQI